MYILGKTNPLLFESIYDCPQNSSGNEVLQLKYGLDKFLTAFTQTRKTRKPRSGNIRVHIF